MRLAGRAQRRRCWAPLRARLGFAGRLAADRLARIPDQLALAGGVLALGLGLMLMAGTLARSFEESVLDFIRHQVRADLVVASTASTGWIESPLPESIGERLAALPGVTRVERVRLAEHDFRGAAHQHRLARRERLRARATRRLRLRRRRSRRRAGRGARRRRASSCRATSRASFGVAVGDRLALDTPAGRYEPTVAGVVVDYVSPRGSVDHRRATSGRAGGSDHGVNRFHVSLAPGATGEDGAARHRRRRRTRAKGSRC